MIVLKGICLCIAIFTTLLFISNLVTDVVSVFSWCNSLHTEEEIKNKNSVSEKFGIYRIILSIIMSITWTIALLV